MAGFNTSNLSQSIDNHSFEPFTESEAHILITEGYFDVAFCFLPPFFFDIRATTEYKTEIRVLFYLALSNSPILFFLTILHPQELFKG